MKAARLAMPWRDACADKLIPLNQCRRKTFWAPWKCEEERHAYELCQYLLYKSRLVGAAEKKAH